MATLESILNEVANLSPTERSELVKMIQHGLDQPNGDEDTAVGLRGLAAWTESVGGDDWSAHYPRELGEPDKLSAKSL